MKTPKKVQKNTNDFHKDFKLKQLVIHLTDLKRLPRTVTLQESPEITIRNDLGTAITSEAEDNENSQNSGIVEPESEHETGCFDENDNSEHESVNVTKADESLVCNLCNERFIDRSAIVNHNLNYHNGDLIFVCTICDGRFRNEVDLEEHLPVHEKGSLFACIKCQVTLNSTFELKLHNAIKHAERTWKKSNILKAKNNFICCTCDFSYEKKSDLLKHIMKSHTRRLAFACKNCELSFSKKCCLKKHLKKHKRKKKYVCSICSSCFQDKLALKDHVTVHIGEKISKCNTCGKRFRSLKIFKKHILAHAGETRYKCSKCETSYTRKFILIEHTQQVVCRKCREVFYCKTNFDEHSEICS